MNRVIPILAAYVNTNTIHGNIREIEAHQLAKKATDELIFLIGLENEKFSIAQENFDVIINTFDDLVFLTLTRAIGDGERMHESDSFKAGEITRGSNISSSGSKGGIRIFGGGK